MKEKNALYLSFGIACLLGTIMHFGYNLFPNPITAVFFPVNESVWEHFKLYCWPFLFLCPFLAHYGRENRPLFFSSFFLQLVSGPIIIACIHYVYTGASGAESLIVDIASLYIAFAAGYIGLGLRTRHAFLARLLPLTAAAAIIFMMMIVVFTYFPPDIPLFISA